MRISILRLYFSDLIAYETNQHPNRCCSTGGGLFERCEEEASRCAFEASCCEGFSISTALGFESEYVSSGAFGAHESLQPALEIAYREFAFGWFMNNPIDDDNNDEHDFWASYTRELCEYSELTVGVTYYLYPKTGSTPNRTREFNLSFAYDTFLNPELAFNHDFDLEQTEWVLAVSHSFVLDSICPRLNLETGVAVGYLNAEDADSDQVAGKTQNGYAYAEANVDLVYAIKDNLTFSFGPRVATNNDGKINNVGKHESRLWWGTQLSATW